MTRQEHRIIWLVWSILMLMLSAFYTMTGTLSLLQSPDVLAFLALVILTAFFPITYRNHMLTLFQWVTLAVFLKYGFGLEVFVTQLGVLCALIATGLSKKTLYRVPINSTIFLLTSLVSAGVFFLVGGQAGGEFSFQSHGHAMLFYAVAFLMTNHFLIYAARRFLFRIVDNYVWQGLIRELATAGLLIPMAFVLVILHNEIGLLAILSTGVVFLGISIVFKLYNRTERTNNLLKKVTEFGYELNSSMSMEELMSKVRERLDFFLDWENLYLYHVKDQKLSLIYMDQKEYDVIPLRLKDGDDLSKQVVSSGKLLLATERKRWSIDGTMLPSRLETVLSIPLNNQQAVKGVLTVASKQKNAFRPHQVIITEIIANMLTIALANVQQLEKTKQQSYHCPLTNLYNFRYFEESLKNVLEEDDELPTSLILLDLDHFKQINDTYGHQSGNDVLCEVARRLQSVATGETIVARYGGEEFVLLLPNTTEQEAYEIGTYLQHSLKKAPISIKNDLTGHSPISVTVTASIGVASSERAKEEDEPIDPVTLIRKADRAMYNGAKQRGRDRVASYSQLKKLEEPAS